MHQEIIKQFFPGKKILESCPFGNGHINDTFKVSLQNDSSGYILQRINTGVFKHPQEIINTHFKLLNHISDQTEGIVIPELYPTIEGKYLYIDSDNNAWRMTGFIKGSRSIEVVDETWQAIEAGNAYGWFAKKCADLKPGDFKEAIKDFHRLSFRVNQLQDAIVKDKANRLEKIKNVVDFFITREKPLKHIETLVDRGDIPLHVVHNDTKINNVLFKGSKVAAVIDLDTVGPGILYYDYGDAIRTSANTAKEDEKDLDKVQLNIEAFDAFTRGYMNQVKDFVSEKEKEYFYLAPVLITYIIGIRFLADYLNGDIYFKTAYAEHNLVRCKVQKAFIESMEKNQQTMIQIISRALKTV